MIVKLDVYPYDAVVGLGPIDSFSHPDYHDRVADAIAWLGTIDCELYVDCRPVAISGAGPAKFEFKRLKEALLFKMAWG
jgi:hypothetical protein